jgi:hypothetical protein
MKLLHVATASRSRYRPRINWHNWCQVSIDWYQLIPRWVRSQEKYQDSVIPAFGLVEEPC